MHSTNTSGIFNAKIVKNVWERTFQRLSKVAIENALPLSRAQIAAMARKLMPDELRLEATARYGRLLPKLFPRYIDVESIKVIAQADFWQSAQIEVVEPIEKGQPLRYRLIIEEPVR